jgi:dienelactone hydrolase
MQTFLLLWRDRFCQLVYLLGKALRTMTPQVSLARSEMSSATCNSRTAPATSISGATQAALFGMSDGGAMSILFAATYPDRTRALVLYGVAATSARGLCPQTNLRQPLRYGEKLGDR